MTVGADRVLVSPAWLRRAATSILTGAGVPSSAAATVAEALVDADMRGISSHGVMLLPMYVERILAGSVSRATEARVATDFGAIAVLDAEHALGVLTADQAMTIALGKARTHGIGLVTVRHAFHFGAAFRYVQQAARSGCIGVAACNTRPMMPAPGGAKAVVGNNPLAIGAPLGGEDAVILDMALSEGALGKIRLAADEGRAIPENWATDGSGIPTTDPAAAIRGLLLPIAGPKGYGLALMLDVLSGVLSDGSYGSAVRGLYTDPAIANDCAHVFLAIDPRVFGDRSFASRVAALTTEVTSSPVAPDATRVLHPGQLEAERHRHAQRHGIAVPAAVLEKLAETAAKLGVTRAPKTSLRNGNGVPATRDPVARNDPRHRSPSERRRA
ncbi:Ldh family oxidoreductase [Amycolatopsis jejuensis]|uniref:Ldh family oxidoreductase n=1 Tax=Amycolatopsis jejuensis TaxID=330084 RepID=UPI0009FE6F4F|nr:Ldh family oxidoreductase [Amycolatopsis jejuensis]